MNKYVTEDGMMRVWVMWNRTENNFREGSIANPKLPAICLFHSPTETEYKDKKCVNLETHPMREAIELLGAVEGMEPGVSNNCTKDFFIPEDWWNEEDAFDLNERMGW